MTDVTLAKGVLFGTCFTSGCHNAGSTVHGIAGQANMWEGNSANYTHRCGYCHDLIRAILDHLLIGVQRDEQISEKEATIHKSFVAVGRTVLGMDLDQLKGAKL